MMMNRFAIIFGILFLMGIRVVGYGQQVKDSLKLTGTMADTLIAKAKLNQADQLLKSRDFNQAELIASNAKELYAATTGPQSYGVMQCLILMGRATIGNRQYETSIKYLQQAEQINQELDGDYRLNFADIQLNLGICHEGRGFYEKAINLKTSAFTLYQQILPPADRKIAICANSLGSSYESLRQIDKALHYQKIALDIIIEIDGEESESSCLLYSNIGVSHWTNLDYDQAVFYHSKALNIRKKIHPADHPNIGVSLNNLGLVYESKGDFKKAKADYEAAIAIFEKKTEKRYLEIAANIYNNLGFILQTIGQYSQALNAKEKALELTIQVYSLNSVQAAKAWTNLGSACRDMEYYDRAFDCFKTSIKIRRAIGLIQHVDDSFTYNNLGSIFLYRKNNEAAMACFDTALAVQKKLNPNNYLESAICYSYLGNGYEAQGKWDLALEAYYEALNLRRLKLSGQHPAIILLHNNIGRVYKHQKKNNRSRFHYQSAFDGFGDFPVTGYLNNPSSWLTTISGLSSCHFEVLQQSQDTIHYQEINEMSEKTWSFLQKQKRQNPYESDQYKLADAALPIFESSVKANYWLWKREKNKVPFETSYNQIERIKAQKLYEAFRESYAEVFSGLPDSITKEALRFEVQITDYEKRHYQKLLEGNRNNDSALLAINDIIFKLSKDYLLFMQQIEARYPEYYRLKYDLSTVSLDYVQDSLLQDNQVLLEYFVGDSSLYFFVVRPDTFIVEAVRCDSLEDWIEQFRQGLYSYHTDKNKPDALFEQMLGQYLQYAPKLYEILIKPVEQWLPKDGRVIIVPDGPLGYIPFDALITGPPADPLNFKTYPYLLNKYQFSYTYSATLLREMRDKRHRKTPAGDFAAYAPFYDGNSTILENRFSFDELMPKDLKPLPFSGQEVAAASKIMKGKIVSGAQATKAHFIQDASNYRILHLATHGRADNRVGDYAFLVFSEIKDSIDNELLYVKDLYNLSLNADLVVLSACETGIGKLQRGEGIISLARAFAYAGAKSMVTSLWSVNDASTYQLMRYFYRNLKKGNTKDEALSNARLDYLKREKANERCHPFYWAAFVPVGDMRPVHIN